jgi:hypothetical protein
MKLWEEVAEAAQEEVAVLSAEAEVGADAVSVAVWAEVAVHLEAEAALLGVAVVSVSQEILVQADPLSVPDRSSPADPFLEAAGAAEEEALDVVSGAA